MVAAHVLGRQANWDPAAARLGAELFARRRDGQGHQIAKDAETFSEMVLACVTRRSAEAVLETVFAEDGLDGGVSVANPLVQRAVRQRRGMARLSIVLDRPVIGLYLRSLGRYMDPGSSASHWSENPKEGDSKPQSSAS